MPAGHVIAETLRARAHGPGWDAVFDLDGEEFVVFPRRVMRYRVDDASGRAEAYARALAIPDAQLDW